MGKEKMKKMSNSSLVNYKRLSPNHSGTRNHKIDTITIHHMAGNLTVEQCGAVFASRSRQASSNYGIGTDGRIGMYVEEKNRAWTTGSSSNDNRAITIEVANSKVGEPWPISDKAMASLINLCADICKRNGIAKLNYTGNKSGNMTLHKWFQATGCPGTYLSGKMKYIQDEVNKKLTGKKTTTKKSTSTKPVITYAVCTKEDGWLPDVKDLSDYAGYSNHAITDVAIKASKGSVFYRVHVLGGKWLSYVNGFDKKEPINGYAGIGKPIDAIQVKYTNPEGKFYKIKYRVAPKVLGTYYSWQTGVTKNDTMDGYSGKIRLAISKFQIYLV